MAAWESACWRSASDVVAVTAEDAAKISSERSYPAQHVPNGVQISEPGFLVPEARTSANVLFLGLMDHPPNVRAAELLATEIMPLVWRQRSDAKLVLCGANPARAVLRLAGPRVSVTGRVPSTAPFLAQARVFANCLSYGAGSSLKVLEALAAGVPLVSTQAGVRGFALRPEDHYIAAESAAEFAGAILRCLEAPRGAPDMLQRARAGRTFAEAHSWTSHGERFAALAVRAAEGGKREPVSVPAPRW
jgi:glycosyltransferase involved in cell wall biosynthesis